MRDIVIDTNVWVFASDDASDNCADCVGLLGRLKQDAEVELAIDEPSGTGTTSVSLILDEYARHIPHGSESHAILLLLGEACRVVQVARPDNHVHKIVNKFIKASKPRDRTFLWVANASKNQVLVTLDYEDFPSSKRKAIKRTLDVHVLDPDHAHEVFWAD